jgi:hypothetical protein
MRSRIASFGISVAVGVLLTAVLQAASYFAYEMGFEYLSYVLNWPNVAVQSLVPCINIGTPEQPLCEGTPINYFAYLVSVPAGAAVYIFVAYVLIRRRAHHVL